MSERNITIRREISAFVLFSVWIMVFVLPAFLVNFSLQYLFDITRSANRRAFSSAMTNDMESFKSDLDTASCLQKRIESCFGNLTIQPDFANPQAFADLLARESGIRPVGIVAHATDTVDISVYFAERFADRFRNLSRNLMRRYLVTLNQQYQYSCHTDENAASIEGLFRFVEPQKAKKDSDMFLRRVFGLITEAAILPGRVSRSVSAAFAGPLYFYYQPFFSDQPGMRKIKGGFLLIFAGADIPWNLVAADAIAAPTSGLQRGLATSRISYWEINSNNRDIVTRFHEDEEGFHLLSTISQTAVVDLIQGGTFMTKNIRSVLQKMPLLKVSVPWSALQHPLSRWSKHIVFGCRIFAMLGALFLLNFFFFGVEFKAGIASKVVTGTAFILLLPVILLFVGFLTWHQYGRIYAWYAAEIKQQRLFDDLNEKLTAYQQELQQNSFDVASSVAELVATGRYDDVRECLRQKLDSSLASEIALDLPGGRAVKVESTSRRSAAFAEEDSNRRLSSIAVFSAFDDNGIFTKTTHDKNEPDITAIDSRFVNDVISRWGRFYQLFRFHTGSRFSSIYLHKPGRNDPLALLTIKYSDEHLLRALVSRYLRESDRAHDVYARYYIIRDDAGVKRYFSLADNSELTDPEMIGRFNLAAASGQYSVRPNGCDLLQIFAMSDYPLILLTRIDAVAGQHGSLYFVTVLLLYAMLLLLFVFLVFVIIYLRPIREFIRVTEKVAAGDYQCQVDLDQTDEFGDLKQTFDTMIHGLEQRRRLTQFVSSEVIKAVESDSEESMAVGGERVEATVAFVQLAMLQHLKSEASPEEIFATLGDFIAAADIAASQHGGVVDKLVEDTLMLVFRADPARPEHALAASAAVLDLEHQMSERGLRICAGIASGQVVSGRIGSRLGKLDLTVIGDPVNLAARLKAQAKKAANTGIIAPGAIRILKGRARVTFIERTELKGKSREYPLYELVALRSA
ncbi:MAG: adenylate/guanylate cyclase domain-containing protein [Candidatus Riflebacteria bacterium]|nr:adenylate/guanylate cyclase domain-containing protein [Candidatus Riflebacteria bacterium]